MPRSICWAQQGALFDPLLHNTVNATVVRGGAKENVIPSEITVALDGRLLPGYTPDEMLAELRQLAGDVAEFSAGRSDLTPFAEPDMGLFETLAGILREADPEGTPIPLLLSGITDGRYFARLGSRPMATCRCACPPTSRSSSLSMPPMSASRSRR